MRDEIIKKLAAVLDGDVAAAEDYYNTFVAKVCGGREPTTSSFRLINKDRALAALPVLDEGVFRAALWPDKPADAGGPPPPKGKRFKPEKANTYTGADLVAFLKDDPKQPGLRAEVLTWTRGEKFRFVVDGELKEAETAARLDALKAKRPVASFVKIGDEEVKPIGYPEDGPVFDPGDPFQRGKALGQPGNVSELLGMSLDGIQDETIRAIECACAHDLKGAPVVLLQGAAREAKGRPATDFLTSYPAAKRAWKDWPKSKLEVLREEEAAPQPAKSAPRPPEAPADKSARVVGKTEAPWVYLVGAEFAPEAAERIKVGLATALRAGRIRLLIDTEMKPGQDEDLHRSECLRKASVVLFLLTSSFIASDYFDDLTRTAKLKVPVFVEVTSLSETCFAGIGGLPRDKPISRWADKDSAYVQIVDGILGMKF